MKKTLLVLSCLFSLAATAQTKLIFHRSHSGSINSFYELLENRDVNLSFHNLGAGPERIVVNAQLDSVIYVDDTTTVMITSEYCSTPYRDKMNYYYVDSNVYENYPVDHLWSAGIDTIYNNKVWNQDDPKDIKKDLKRDFHFRNDVENVVFIDFPTDEPQQDLDQDSIKTSREAGVDVKQNSIIPVGGDSKPGIGITIAITLTLVLSIVIYLRNWRKQLFASKQE